MKLLPSLPNRRTFMASSAAVLGGAASCASAQADRQVAQIAITLDLEMSRNFPTWEQTHWDYEKGNLNAAAKQYTLDACQRVKQRGGRIHTFVVGQVLEHESVDWLATIAREGHAIGNHTYDHVYMLARTNDEIQFRFKRSPWLIAGRSVPDVLRENVRLTSIALHKRIGIEANGFRTPGGFASGLDGREDVQQMLIELGFRWISCKYPAHAGIESLFGTDRAPSNLAIDNIVAAQAAAQPYRYPTGLLEIPMSPISDIGAFRTGRWQLNHFLDAIRLAVQWCIDHGATFDFLAHPSCLGVVDPQFRTIDLICDLVERSAGKSQLVTLDKIANRYL